MKNLLKLALLIAFSVIPVAAQPNPVAAFLLSGSSWIPAPNFPAGSGPSDGFLCNVWNTYPSHSYCINYSALQAIQIVLPTSCSGLSTGALYNNSGTPAICP